MPKVSSIGVSRYSSPRTASGLKPLRTSITRRSEEHTSELQSQFHLVCGLLLEKKDFVGQPVARLVERHLAGEHFHPVDARLAAVGLLEGGIEHAHRGAPDFRAGAGARDAGDDR